MATQKKSPLFDTATTLGKITAFFGVSALAGALVAGLFLPLGMIGGAAASTGAELLDQLPAELQEEPLSEPSVILAKDGSPIATFYAEDRTPVALDEISEHMQNAVIAIEDERFYEHAGVDGQGLARAMVNNLTTDTTQGASTLTQQYVNNVLVNYQNLNDLRTTVSGTKDIPDKLREMKLAVAIEKEMSKEEILEGYLNIVLFSGRVYGVEAAARHFFDKSAAELNIQESALLAGMVQSPNALNPENNPEGALNRRNVVLRNMFNQGFITEEEYTTASQSEIELHISPLASGCMAANFDAGYFCDFVHQKILADPAFGPDRDARQRLLDRGGLTIKTTLDPKLQQAAADQASETVPATDIEGLGSSLVTVEQNTGHVLAMAQNTEYSPETGQMDKTTVNFSTDHDWGGSNGFQGGSSLKPFVFLAWLGEGHSMNQQIDATRRDYSRARFPAYCLDGGTAYTDKWNVRNAISDMTKKMKADYGLYWSINTATVAAAYQTDLCSITDITTAAGIHGAQTNEPLNPANPSFILGAQEVSPLTMAAGYSTLASGGTYCTPRILTEVTDKDGNSYEVPAVQCNENALNKDHIEEMNSTLKGIASRRIAANSLPYDVAGKTGTNNYQNSTWFIGYTSGITTAAWVGYTDGIDKPLAGNTIGGTYYRNVYGSEIAGPMWLKYMRVAAPEYPTDRIPSTGGTVAYGPPGV